MTADKIKSRIAEICTLFGFEYKGKDGNVDPYSSTEFLLYYDGNEKTVHSIDEVMNTPFFGGHSLTEIAEDIIITEY